MTTTRRDDRQTAADRLSRALEVDGHPDNWPLLDDVEDKPIVLVIDAQYAISGHRRDGVVEFIAKAKATSQSTSAPPPTKPHPVR
jgi:hypothetical protein